VKKALSKTVARKIVKLFIEIHNFTYKIISRLSIIAEGGIHPKHRLTKYHEFFVNNISTGDIVLDVGCGNGFLKYDIAWKAKHVTAIDLNPKNIEFAKNSSTERT